MPLYCKFKFLQQRSWSKKSPCAHNLNLFFMGIQFFKGFQSSGQGYIIAFNSSLNHGFVYGLVNFDLKTLAKLRVLLILGKPTAPNECCICYTRKTDKSGSGYEKLIKCTTEEAAKNLKSSVERKQDNPTLFANIAGKDWEAIVPYDLHYHRTCYYLYVKKPSSVETEINEAFQMLIKFVEEKIFVDNGTLTPMELLHYYNNSTQSQD